MGDSDVARTTSLSTWPLSVAGFLYNMVARIQGCVCQKTGKASWTLSPPATWKSFTFLSVPRSSLRQAECLCSVDMLYLRSERQRSRGHVRLKIGLQPFLENKICHSFLRLTSKASWFPSVPLLYVMVPAYKTIKSVYRISLFPSILCAISYMQQITCL